MFDSIDTEEKAYWLGFIYADGNIMTVTKKIQTYTLNITLKNSDIEHLHKFNTFMSGTVNIRQNTNSCIWQPLINICGINMDVLLINP